jgi:very-short-patch-repair endonuclease
MKSNIDSFIVRANKIHNNKYDYSLVEYVNTDVKIKIKCKEHGLFEQRPSCHLKGQGCPKCYGNKKLNVSDFIKKFSIVHNNKYDYSSVEYKNNRTKVKIICKEHGIFEQSPETHKKHGCPLCSKIYTNDFINSAKNIHHDKYDYSLTIYINAKSKVKIICKKHGVFEQIPNNHLNGKGCSLCFSSKGEKIIEDILKNNDIKHIPRYSFNDCRYKNPLFFDFYLPENNLCIEYDGEQHFTKFRYEKNNDRLLERQKRDKIKDEYCKTHNICMIRIKYNENIYDKLSYMIKNQRRDNVPQYIQASFPIS